MVVNYERDNSQNRSVGDNVTADRLQDINEDLDALFARLDSRDLSITRNALNRVTKVVDNINSITINIDWADRGASPWKLYIQEQWDTKRFTITYSTTWYPNTILYA